MLTQATYQQAGIPFNLLGQPYQKWRSDDLRLLLNNFGITTMEAAQKIDLMHGLHHLIENGLMPDDPDIVARLQQGRSLPTLSGVDTLALGGRTLEDLLGGELTSARIKNLQRQRRAFTSEDFALPNLDTSSETPSLGLISEQDDAEAEVVEDGNDDEVLVTVKTDCVVCLEPLTVEVQNSSKITPACNHRRDVCDECLRHAIALDLEQKVWDRIGCPSCGTLLAPEEVIRHGDPKAVAKYEERLTLASLSSDPNFHLCRHPGCTFGQEIAPDTNQQFMTCLQCHQLTCLSCRTVWHAGITCAQNIRNIKGPTAEQQKEEEASEALVAKTSKTCPNATCGARVDKISGCDHMRCSRCGSQYCWECKADQEKIWSEGNSAHKEECKHWRPIGRESPDVSDTSDDEDLGYLYDTDGEDAQPPEPRQRQRRGAIGREPVGRNSATWEQDSQQPLPGTRTTQEGFRRMMLEQGQERLRADAHAQAAEQVNQQGRVPGRGQTTFQQNLEATIPREDPRARVTEPGRIMREEHDEAAGIRMNRLVRALGTAHNQAAIPDSIRTTQDQSQEDALQRLEAFARVHQRRVENRAMRFHQAREGTSPDQHTPLSTQSPRRDAAQQALQAARERAQQELDALNRDRHIVEQHAQRADHHRVHIDVHELERMSAQPLRDKIAWLEQRVQDIAHHRTTVPAPDQRQPQPTEGQPQQRQPEPIQQQALAPALAHQEQALVQRQPARSFSAARQPPRQTTLAPPPPGFPRVPGFPGGSPALTPHPPIWISPRPPQPPQPPPWATPIFPPGIPLFNPITRLAPPPNGPLFSNPFGSSPSPQFSNPSPSNTASGPNPSPTSPPSSPSSPSNPIRSTTPPLPISPALSSPPAPPTGTPESLPPLLRLQRTPDPAHRWVWTLAAGHFDLSEYPSAALVPPLAGVGRQLRVRAVMSDNWAIVRRMGGTENEIGMERLVVDAWEGGGGGGGGGGREGPLGGIDEIHRKWRRIGNGFPSRGRGK